MPSTVMQREPVLVPRLPGVFALLNTKSRRCAYVAYTSDLQKRSHSLSHMLSNPKTHWAIRDLPKAPAGEWTFTVVDAGTTESAATKLIAHTEKVLTAKKYRIVEGSRSAVPTISLEGQRMTLTEAIAKSKCKTKYITVWRRIARGWTVEQALDLADPPTRWNPDETRQRRKRARN